MVSDQLSKGGDQYRRAIATVCEGFTLPDAARKILETALWAPLAESAAPVEVGGAKWTPEEVARQLAERPNQPHYIAALVRKAIAQETATLARQLAESESALAAATRRVAEVERWREASKTERDYYADAMRACADELAAHAEALREVEAYRDATFDGQAVYAALTSEAKRRTSADNVADVLDALNRVARATGEGEGNE